MLNAHQDLYHNGTESGLNRLCNNYWLMIKVQLYYYTHIIALLNHPYIMWKCVYLIQKLFPLKIL